MNNAVLVPKPDELNQFINFLFEGLEGYMYVVAKEPDNPESWDQAFFEYPAQAAHAIKAIKHYSASHEVYMAPALFKIKNGQMEHVKCSNVLWCDFDGNTPESFDIPPSLVVRSSSPGHEHVYWKLDTPLQEVEQINDYNRRLCYKYGADNSGWDANQVLRPPYTINHKRAGASVAILQSQTSLSINAAIVDSLAPAPEKTVDYSLWEKLDLPDLNGVIYSNKFGPDFRLIFEKAKDEVGDRSASLTNMSYICAEAGLGDKEIYVILDHLATRWEKFKHHTRSNRARQLISIIEHTRVKYPNNSFTELDEVFEYSPVGLLNTDIEIDWAIDDLLIKNGVMMLAGPGGIGKSRLSLQFMFHLAMGKPFLGYNITKPQRINFMSLEMGDLELKLMLTGMYPVLQGLYSPEELTLLNQNLKLIPFGEALSLNTQQGQDVFLEYMERDHPDGVFVDSIGSAILGSISDSTNVQNFTNFNDKVRKRYGCYLWYIHHLRKAAPGTKSYGEADDIYGDAYLSNKATTVYTMTKAKDGLLRIRNTKQRHAPTEETYLIRQEEGSMFTRQGVEDSELPNALENIVKGNNKNPEAPENDASPDPFKW